MSRIKNRSPMYLASVWCSHCCLHNSAYGLSEPSCSFRLSKYLPAFISFHECYFLCLYHYRSVTGIPWGRTLPSDPSPGGSSALSVFAALVLARLSGPLKLKIPSVWSCQLAGGQAFYSLVWPGNGAEHRAVQEGGGLPV